MEATAQTEARRWVLKGVWEAESSQCSVWRWHRDRKAGWPGEESERGVGALAATRARPGGTCSDRRKDCLGLMWRAGGVTKGPEPGCRSRVDARVPIVFGFCCGAWGWGGGAQASAAGTVTDQPCSGSEGTYLHRPIPHQPRAPGGLSPAGAPCPLGRGDAVKDCSSIWAALLGPRLACSARMVLSLANELVTPHPEPCACPDYTVRPPALRSAAFPVLLGAGNQQPPFSRGRVAADVFTKSGPGNI